jgi:two-component system, LytTR family, sensor histidine kinase AlgZ
MNDFRRADCNEQVKSLLQQCMSIMLKMTFSYRLIMMAILFIGFAFNWSVHQSISEGDTKELERAYFWLSWLGPALFIFFSHIAVRTYLKLKIINQPLKPKLLVKYAFFLLLVSVISFSLSYLISLLDIFTSVRVRNIQFINEQKLINLQALELLRWFAGILSYLALYSGWSVCYVFWNQLLAKKALKIKMQQAQMQQLTNQLSPHFLFNTFNSIRALIYEDQDKAANTITQLSELFRTHFQAHLRVKSSLQEEWQVTQRYLMIEKLRLEERLEVSCDFPEELLEQDLPTLTLLTLVENAIKHGISPCISPGFLKISASRINSEFWLLRVSNSYDKKNNTTGTQVGLGNVKARLKLMFGENHKLTQSKQYNEFSIILELPIA